MCSVESSQPRTLRRRCSATSGERGRHYRVGLRPAPRLALWSSHKRADVAEVVADLSTGVTNSEPSSRIDSYHPNETSQVRPLDRALRFGDASGRGPSIGHRLQAAVRAHRGAPNGTSGAGARADRSPDQRATLHRGLRVRRSRRRRFCAPEPLTRADGAQRWELRPEVVVARRARLTRRNGRNRHAGSAPCQRVTSFCSQLHERARGRTP